MTALGRLVLFCLRHAREPEELITSLARWLDLVREVHGAPGGREALARVWRYIFVVSNPAKPADLVAQLVGVVGKESKEDVMTVAEWLEQKGLDRGRNEGRSEALSGTLLRQLRKRFGEVPEPALARISAADDGLLATWLDRIVTASTLDEVLAPG